jgi:adenosylhomocysteine nucleosidase
MSFDAPARSGGARKVAFIAALDSECASLRRRATQASSWLVVQSGPGSARAAAAAATAAAGGATLLVAWGLAGGLDPKLAAGAVIAPRRVRTLEGPPIAVAATWHARLAQLGGELALETGDLLTTDTALESPEAKRSAAAASGAVAVDMESAGVAEAAARAGLPFIALRVVVDGAGDALPHGAERWIDERGNRRFAPTLRAIVSVKQWRPLLTLAQRYRCASATLDRLAEMLAGRRLLADDLAARGTQG